MKLLGFDLLRAQLEQARAEHLPPGQEAPPLPPQLEEFVKQAANRSRAVPDAARAEDGSGATTGH